MTHIWHDNKKKPKLFRKVLFCIPGDTYCGEYDAYSDSFQDDDTLNEYGREVVNKWAYLDDVVEFTHKGELACNLVALIEKNAPPGIIDVELYKLIVRDAKKIIGVIRDRKK